MVFAENVFSCSSVFADSDMFTDYADSGRPCTGLQWFFYAELLDNLYRPNERGSDFSHFTS
jgi:hypothetical protein